MLVSSEEKETDRIVNIILKRGNVCEFIAQKRTFKSVSRLMDLLLLIREALTKIGHYISGSLYLQVLLLNINKHGDS